MRHEMIGAVVRRAMEHPEFRRRLLDNPQEALADHGFALEAAEMAELEKIRATLDRFLRDSASSELASANTKQPMICNPGDY